MDGGWYRTRVDLPSDWQGLQIYVSTQGVDDYYELYVNGVFAASGGDLETQATAFEERKSHNVTAHVSPGQPCQLAIRVYDWFGAGGIHRPITIGTSPLASGVQVLKE